jgi:hypothetical protein
MSFARNRLHKRRFLLAALALAAMSAVAAACGGAHNAAGSAPTPRSPAAAWHQVVLCARAHGMPTLPDLQIDSSGNAIIPAGLTIPQETRQACQSLYDRLIPNAQNQAPTQAQLAGLLRFARCMRSHGIPDWPDPRPDGTFAPDARISQALKSTFRSQLTVCDHFNPDPRGRVYFSRG